MPIKKKPEEQEDESWLATYADAITLLMCFFIIILNVSEPSQAKFEEVKEGLMTEFKSQEKVVEKPFSAMEAELMNIVEKNNLNLDMGVGKTDKGVMLELASGTFFESGSAKFKEEAIPVLDEIVKAIVNFAFDYPEYKIEVAGHTDDVPISTPIFPSNWELSAGRAASVVRFFGEKGIESDQMKAIGMGAAYPKVPNEDEFGSPIPENREINRRVVVKIERKL